MAEAGSIWVKLKLDDQITSGLKKIGGMLAGAFAIKEIWAFTEKAIELGREMSKTEKLISQALKNTGEAAGFNQAQLTKMAEGLTTISNFDRTDILKNVTFQLLSFKTVTGDVFKRAQESVLDLSAALGIDLKSAADTVGKALDDPVRGVRLLRSLNIVLTQSEKDLIKQFEDTGQTAKAQGVILDAISSRFGGQAANLANPFIQMKNAAKEAEAMLGTKFLPVLKLIGEEGKSIFESLTEVFKSSFDELENLESATKTLETSTKPLIDRYEELKGKTKLNKDEQVELHKIINKIAELIPTAVTEWNKLGGAMDIDTTAAWKYIESQKELVKLKNAEEIENPLPAECKGQQHSRRHTAGEPRHPDPLLRRVRGRHRQKGRHGGQGVHNHEQ